jgi:hypothetical protein
MGTRGIGGIVTSKQALWEKLVVERSKVEHLQAVSQEFHDLWQTAIGENTRLREELKLKNEAIAVLVGRGVIRLDDPRVNEAL